MAGAAGAAPPDSAAGAGAGAGAGAAAGAGGGGGGGAGFSQAAKAATDNEAASSNFFTMYSLLLDENSRQYPWRVNRGEQHRCVAHRRAQAANSPERDYSLRNATFQVNEAGIPIWRQDVTNPTGTTHGKGITGRARSRPRRRRRPLPLTAGGRPACAAGCALPGAAAVEFRR